MFGFDRGKCIDRYYIEQFLSANVEDIRGHVLEIANNNYTRKFGANRVVTSDVLHAAEGKQGVTIVADLVCGDNIESNTFDCIILTQTLQFIYDTRAALKTLSRILKPGGVILATFSGISQISRYDMDRWGDYWRFTSLSAQRLFREVFPADNIDIQTYGNVLTSVAFLHGLSVDELHCEELDYVDPDYELLITIKAIKPTVSV